MKSKCKMLAAAFLIASGMVLSPQTGVAQDNKIEKQDKKMPKGDMKNKMGDSKMKMSMDELKTWPEAAQMAAKDMMEKYGKPDEMTSTMAVWHNNGPWKKTVISKMESKHDFPKTHMDCMEQCINHKVPLDMYDDELAQFDGSVTVDRTQGTIAARCDKEENNFLALNLAHDVITKKKSVEEARQAYGDMIKQAMSGNKPEYMKKLMFTSEMNSPDSDVNTIGM